jgi:hypothetical protein
LDEAGISWQSDKAGSRRMLEIWSTFNQRLITFVSMTGLQDRNGCAETYVGARASEYITDMKIK